MTGDEAFLQDTLEHPDDDTPRLIYADWLDEHGDPDRAEFIRLQIGAVKLPSGSRRRVARHERQRQLLHKHEQRWTAPLHGIVQRARFVRGFVEQVFVIADGFLPRAEELFRLAPIRHLIVTEVGTTWAELANLPSLRRLSTFELRGVGIDVAKARLLAGSPHLSQLTSLILRYGAHEEEAVVVLAGSPTFSRLKVLDLYGSAVAAQAMDALTHSPHFANLSYLALGDIEEGDAITRALADPGSLLTGLTELYLGFTDAGDEGAARLAGSPHFARLEVLDLMFDRIEEAGARALAGSSHFRSLKALHLQGNPLDARTRRALKNRFRERVWL